MQRQGDTDAVQMIVERLISDYSPQKVILFGSRVVGSQSRDSDIDLLIIKDTQESFFDRLASERYPLPGVFAPPEEEGRFALESSQELVARIRGALEG